MRGRGSLGISAGRFGSVALVASNLPINSVGSSTFSVGRSSMGIKSLTFSVRGVGRGSWLLASAFSSGLLSATGSAGFSAWVSWGDLGAASAASCFTLRGRPGLRFCVVAGVSSVLFSSLFSGCAWDCVSWGALLLLGVSALGVLVFLEAVRARFCFSTLRSSFSLSAAIFLVAPAMACSSSIL